MALFCGEKVPIVRKVFSRDGDGGVGCREMISRSRSLVAGPVV